jgi:hypothetical protein
MDRSTRYTLYYPKYQHQPIVIAESWYRRDEACGWSVAAYLSNLVALAPVHSSPFGESFEEGCLSGIAKRDKSNKGKTDTATRSQLGG